MIESLKVHKHWVWNCKIVHNYSPFIGRGKFGKVFKGQYTLPNGHQQSVAIKTVRECATHQYEALLQEIRIMSHIHNNRSYDTQHPNVVALIGAVTTHLRRGLMGDIHFYIYLGKLYMVMEYCNIGSLENYLQEQCGIRTSVDSVGNSCCIFICTYSGSSNSRYRRATQFRVSNCQWNGVS
jgi:serine/threonine protein kinase